MSRPLRHHATEQRPILVEVTCRTIQGRLLLKPSPEVTSVVLGILGRALFLYKGVRVIDFTVLSNHYHFDLLADDEESLARFMGYINSLLATKVAAKIHDWRARTWADRYRSISIIGEQKMIERVRYVYSQALHHDLVGRPELWPGATSIRARLFGEPLVGLWYDATKMYRKRRRNIEVRPEDFATSYEIELAPLPCWAHLSEEEYRGKVKDLVLEIVEEALGRWELEGRRPMGAAAVLQQDPWSWPENMKHSPAPLCHASSLQREIYRNALRVFQEHYDWASKRFRSGDFTVEFPAYCFRPAGPFVRLEKRRRPGKASGKSSDG